MLHQKVCPLLQDVENVITCQICLLRMEKPKTLTCLHSFCLKCIEGFALKEDGLLYCPVCRKQAKVSTAQTILIDLSSISSVRWVYMLLGCCNILEDKA